MMYFKTQFTILLFCWVILSLTCLALSSRSTSCDTESPEQVVTCKTDFESDISDVRPDDPLQVTCCLITRLETCLSDARQGACQLDTERDVSRLLKRTRTARPSRCHLETYPSVTCYAYLYREMITIVTLVCLFSFSCCALILCCRTCCYDRPSHKLLWLKSAQLEHRPLIIVTHHH